MQFSELPSLPPDLIAKFLGPNCTLADLLARAYIALQTTGGRRIPDGRPTQDRLVTPTILLPRSEPSMTFGMEPRRRTLEGDSSCSPEQDLPLPRDCPGYNTRYNRFAYHPDGWSPMAAMVLPCLLLGARMNYRSTMGCKPSVKLALDIGSSFAGGISSGHCGCLFIRWWTGPAPGIALIGE